MGYFIKLNMKEKCLLSSPKSKGIDSPVSFVESDDMQSLLSLRLRPITCSRHTKHVAVKTNMAMIINVNICTPLTCDVRRYERLTISRKVAGRNGGYTDTVCGVALSRLSAIFTSTGFTDRRLSRINAGAGTASRVGILSPP
jgi:hypothetical protein